MHTQELSWLDRAKKGLKLDSLSSRLDLSRSRLIEITVFLAIGFLIGILWKKCSQYVIAGLLFIGLLFILQHLELINVFINWHAVQETFGLDPSARDISAMLLNWSRDHFLSLIAFVIGLSIGVKVS